MTIQCNVIKLPVMIVQYILQCRNETARAQDFMFYLKFVIILYNVLLIMKCNFDLLGNNYSKVR